MHTPSIPAINLLDEQGHSEPFYIRRIICIGRNYEDHAIEMGHKPNEAPPFFFYKPLTALCSPEKLTRWPMPRYSDTVHHELEVSIAIGKTPTKNSPEDCIIGFGVALDMTCRDIQKAAKSAGRPWDTAKGFDYSAPCSELMKGNWQSLAEHPEFSLTKNQQQVQKGNIHNMIWPIPALLAQLQKFTELGAGDLILTGTPAGVGEVNPGDILEATLKGTKATLKLTIE